MSKVLGVILAGGQGERLSLLSEKRAKPAVPFAGKYRIIDFALSNCVNSDIYDVLVLTQYRPHSLHDHIGRMDYRPMIAFHQQHEADVTLGGVVVPLEEGHRFGILETDAAGRVVS